MSDDVAPEAPQGEAGPRLPSTQSSLLSASAVMAAGTIVSRLSGFVRSTLLVAALGASLHADVFNIANTVPNMLYILLAGGVVNAVLVPQLVRAMRKDPDGGDAYTNRVITLAGLFLAIVTVLLVVAAPLLMRLFLDPKFFTPELAAQRDSVIAFARYCLPQVFFYGMFVLVGQVLNSRGRFGPMMWAPIANNVVSVVILTTYLITIGPATGAEKQGGFTAGAEALLGLGSTLGIVVQFLVLVPYLRSAGFHYRPRFDFRGTGLGHTLRLGVWTVLFVVVNQVAYTVVVRIASSGTVDPTGGAGSAEGTGYTVYSNSFLLTMVPHAIITVSLATAMLPLLSSYAAAGDLAAIGRSVSATLRSAYALVIPAAALLAIMAMDTAHVIWGYGGGADDYGNFAPSLALFGIGLVLFTAHYLVLRGFYALEQNRRVFLIQCGDRGHQHRRRDPAHPRGTALADRTPAGARLRVLLPGRRGHVVHPARARGRRPRRTSPGPLPGPDRRSPSGSAPPSPGGCASCSTDLVPGTSTWHAVLDLAVVGVVFLALYLGTARLLRISEVNDVMALVTRRLRGRR